MVQSTIQSKMTIADINYLLWFDAMQTDNLLVNMRESAYMLQDFGLATKLEKLTLHSQIRLNRRYNNLIH